MKRFVGLGRWPLAFQGFDFLPLLAIRLYLAPLLFVSGSSKLEDYQGFVDWLGNPDWGLGVPAPAFMAVCVVVSEVVGSALLLIGFGTRWASIPLMVLMLVALCRVHWENGWQAVLSSQSPWAPDHADEALRQLEEAIGILATHGSFDQLAQYGKFVIYNDGIEWVVGYLLMLLVLFVYGAGKVSADHFIRRHYMS